MAMTKGEAMELLGCEDDRQLAEALNVSVQVARDWPQVLPPHVARRVTERLYRRLVRPVRGE
jgi:hypothetical protein